MEQMRRIYSPNLQWHHEKELKEMYDSIQNSLDAGEMSNGIANMMREIIQDWLHEERESGEPLNLQELQHNFVEMFYGLQDADLIKDVPLSDENFEMTDESEDSNKEQLNMSIEQHKNKHTFFSYLQRCDDIRDKHKFQKLLFTN